MSDPFLSIPPHDEEASRQIEKMHEADQTLGKAYWESGNGWDIQGKRTFAIWAKTPSSGSVIAINYIDTASNRRLIAYVPGTGTDYTSGAEGFIYLGGTAQDFDAGGWVRIERDLQSDITARFSGTTLQRVTGIYARPGTSSTLDIDDLSFSNSLTVEHNSIVDGTRGMISRTRSTSASTYAATDKWLHHDPTMGIVVATSDSAGDMVQQFHWDRKGNLQQSWSSGLWAAPTSADGLRWRHMRYDADIQMWLGSAILPQTGTWPGEESGGTPSHGVDLGSCGCDMGARLNDALVWGMDAVLRHMGAGSADNADAMMECIYNQLNGGMDVICDETCEGNPNLHGNNTGGYTPPPPPGSPGHDTDHPGTEVHLCGDKLGAPTDSSLWPKGWALVLIHEAAHTCGWSRDHPPGYGLPGENGPIGNPDIPIWFPD